MFFLLLYIYWPVYAFIIKGCTSFQNKFKIVFKFLKYFCLNLVFEFHFLLVRKFHKFQVLNCQYYTKFSSSETAYLPIFKQLNLFLSVDLFNFMGGSFLSSFYILLIIIFHFMCFDVQFFSFLVNLFNLNW